MRSNDSELERRRDGSTSRRSALRRLGAVTALAAGHRSVLARSVRGEIDTVERTDATIESFVGTTIALSRYERETADANPAVNVAQAGVSSPECCRQPGANSCE
jgi:hypothetical protein